VKIHGVVKCFIEDTGSSISLVKPGLFDNRIRETKVSPYGATGDKLKVEGELDADFIVANYRFWHTFIVCELPTEAHGFLGINFLMEKDVYLNLRKRELRLMKPQDRGRSVGQDKRQDQQSFPVLIQPFIPGVSIKLIQEQSTGKDRRSDDHVLSPLISITRIRLSGLLLVQKLSNYSHGQNI
jgi:hypothetical protein